MAVRRSQFTLGQQLFIFWFCAHELLTALFMQQFNIAIAAIILLAYYCIEREKDFWAAFVIMLGTFVKLYGIVGLAFFFFSKHKGRLIVSLLFWAVIMFVAPMIFHGPEYIVGQYQEWFACLADKKNTCPRKGKCHTLPMWTEYDKMVHDFFYKKKLSDLIKE